MISDHDSIINLLNGYLNKHEDVSSNDVFLDRNGQPTDRFLEALKADFETAIPLPESPLKQIKVKSNKNSSNESNVRDISIKNSNKKKVHVNDDLDLNSYYSEDEDDDDSNFDDNIFRSKINRKKKVIKKNNNTANKNIRSTIKKNTVTRKPSNNMNMNNTINTNNMNNITVNASYKSTQPTVEKPVDEEGMEAALEAETKLRTLKLRVAGQQQTIKVLEAQLSEALQTIEIRNKQLAYTRNTSKNKENDMSVRYRAKDDPANQPMFRLNDEVLKCRKEIDDLNNKIQEEREKRLRAEDRAKVLKEYAEKTKIVSQDVREKNGELQKAINEMQSRIHKYRRDCKEYAAEAVAQKTIALERDNECAKEKTKAANADEKLRSVNLELTRSKEDVRSLRKDLHRALDLNKQLGLELDTLKQRDSARKVEMKIQNTPEERRDSILKGKPPRAPTYMRKSNRSLGTKSHYTNDKQYSRFDDLDNGNNNNDSISAKRQNLASFAIEESRRSNESIGSIGSRSVGSIDSKGYRSDRSTGFQIPKGGGSSLSDSERVNSRQPLQNYAVRRSHDSDISFRSTQSVTFIDKPKERPSSAPTSRDNSFSNINVSNRFERLQKMYEKVTGKDSSKIVWKDSSSDDDE